MSRLNIERAKDIGSTWLTRDEGENRKETFEEAEEKSIEKKGINMV